MYIDKNTVLSLGILLYLIGLRYQDNIITALALRFWPTRQQKFVITNPDCECCQGDGGYLHPGGFSLPCMLGCGDPQPRTVVRRTTFKYIRTLGERMGMNKHKAEKFAEDFETLANTYLGAPTRGTLHIEKKKIA